jgi:hypothetical protein
LQLQLTAFRILEVAEQAKTGDKTNWSPQTQGSGPILLHGESPLAKATSPSDDKSAVYHLVKALLDALEGGDWEAFRICFSPEASVLGETSVVAFPQLEGYLQPLFELAQKGVPLLPGELTMRRFRIDLRGAVALVWMLPGKRSALETRALVLMKSTEGWRVKHFHARPFGIGIPSAADQTT